MRSENKGDVVVRLRRQNEQIKDLVTKVIPAKLTWSDMSDEL